MFPVCTLRGYNSYAFNYYGKLTFCWKTVLFTKVKTHLDSKNIQKKKDISILEITVIARQKLLFSLCCKCIISEDIIT